MITEYVLSLSIFSLEMVILDNVDSTNSMPLSIQSVKWMIQHAPKLIMLGNLRSWCGIDYFDSNSPYFYKSESELSRLKKEIIDKNWDVDLDIKSAHSKKNIFNGTRDDPTYLSNRKILGKGKSVCA